MWTPLYLQASASATTKSGGLPLDTVIRVVSWNIWGLCGIGTETRIAAALHHLKETFGGQSSSPGCLVIMLQEVTKPVLDTIMRCPWVREYFQLTNVEGPKSQYEDVRGPSFIRSQLKWEAAPYFTLMLVAKSLPVQNCFRVPLTTAMGRDALVVDVLSEPTRKEDGKPDGDLIRLCTTHLESLWDPRGYRLSQLSRIAEILRGGPGQGMVAGEGRLIGGLVGGDMNANDKSEHKFHTRPEINLQDVWEDVPRSPPPRLKPFQKDVTLGRSKGNTWGYQPLGRNKGGYRRLDKFLYTGGTPLETVPLPPPFSLEEDGTPNVRDVVGGRIGRLGIGLKVEVEAWEQTSPFPSLRRVRGQDILRPPDKKLISDDLYARFIQLYRQSGRKREEGDLVRRRADVWVSDHFGITVGIRVRRGG